MGPTHLEQIAVPGGQGSRVKETGSEAAGQPSLFGGDAPDAGVPPADLLGPLNEVERKNAPRALYLEGDRSLLEKGRRVAVVGSRRAGEDDRERARLVTRALVGRGITVVSGLADGIDTVAHETAIQRGGRTVAVLGTPLSEAYPKSNEALQRQIVERHLAVSQFAEGGPVARRNFVMRNRTMALLTDATVIVAAGSRSGTRHQGWEAIRLGRFLAILEPLAENGFEWVREQIRYGAEPLPLTDFGLWLDAVPERIPFDGFVL